MIRLKQDGHIAPTPDDAKYGSCEHHWVSKHQPDFPMAIYWVRQCSLCTLIDGANLAEQVDRLVEARVARYASRIAEQRVREALASLDNWRADWSSSHDHNNS
jgi:hypothetical protein